MSVYGYMRVSTGAQAHDDRWGYARQLTDITNYCTTQQLELTHVYQDAITGTTPDRAGLNELLSVMRPGDHVVFASLDRLARDVATASIIAKKLKTGNVHIHSAGLGEFEFGRTESKLMFDIISAVHEAERNQIWERTQSALTSMAKAGKLPNGIKTYGYETDHHGGARILPEQAAVVRMIFKMAIDGHSMRAIEQHLNRTGVAVPRPERAKDGKGHWYPSGVSRIIENPAYKGTYIWTRGDRRYEIAIPPIVTAEQWEAAQHEKRGAPATSGWPLVGHIRCATCGNRMHSKTKPGKSKLYQYYRCQSRSVSTGSCGAPLIPRAPIEEAVEHAIRARFTDPTAIAQMLPVENPDPNDQAKREALLAERDRIRYMWRKGDCTRDEYDTMIGEVDDELNGLQPTPRPTKDAHALAAAASTLPLSSFLEEAGIVIIASLDEVKITFE